MLEYVIFKCYANNVRLVELDTLAVVMGNFSEFPVHQMLCSQVISRGQVRLYLDGSGIYVLPEPRLNEYSVGLLEGTHTHNDELDIALAAWTKRKDEDAMLIENHLKGINMGILTLKRVERG